MVSILGVSPSDTTSMRSQPLLQKISHQGLIPGMPHDLALSILAFLPRASWSTVRSTAHDWREAFESSEFVATRRESRQTEDWVYVVAKSMGKQRLLALDVAKSSWHTVSDLPCNAPIVLSALKGAGDVPLNGFELAAVSGKLLLAGGHKTVPAGAFQDSMECEFPTSGRAAGLPGGRDPFNVAMPTDERQLNLGVPGVQGQLHSGARTSYLSHEYISEEQNTTRLRQPKLESIGSHVIIPGGVWIFDAFRDSWTQAAPMLESSRSYFASGDIGGKVYVAGGLSAVGESLSTAEVYDLVTDTWQFLEPIPSSPLLARSNGRCAGAVRDGQLYVFSVCAARGGSLVLLGIYKPSTSSWTCPHSSPCTRHLALAPASGLVNTGTLQIQTAVVDGRLLFMRGSVDDQQGWADRAVREYDVATNDWSTVAVMPDPTDGNAAQRHSLNVLRQAFSLASTNGKLLLVGGVAWAKFFGRPDAQSVQMCTLLDKPDNATWQSVGQYEEELFLGHAWKCATLSI